MAEIYKARLDGIGGFARTFAIKRILPHLTTRPEFVDMLIDEAKIAGLLSHANIVQILDLGQVGGTYYIAMEYVDGPDLGRVLKRCRAKGITLPVPHAVFIAIEMLKGLEYAHNRQVLQNNKAVPLNIVHRDISPANVLVSYQGEVKLTDFGIAKATVKALETQSGVVKGRFNYISPEAARGDSPDQRGDLFGCGVVLYEMLTGRHPFIRPTEADTLAAIRNGDFPAPSAVNADIPYQLEAVIERALQVDPQGRYATATTMKEALDTFFHDAGFIFSHSTLAAFLKGLLQDEKPLPPTRPPDPTTWADDPSVGGERTSPIPGGEAEEHPTSIELRSPPRAEPFPTLDTHVGRPQTLLEGAPDLSRSQAFGPIAGLGDESTLIRSNPLLDDVRAWSDAETVIKPEPGRNHSMLGEPTRSVPLPTPRVTEATRPPQQQRSRGLSTRFQVLFLALFVVANVVVLFVGFFLGARTARLTQPAQTEAVSIRANPELRVDLPPGASLKVDGRDVPGQDQVTVKVTPGEAHTVRVEGPGFRPVETSLTLDYNDLRVLSVQVEAPIAR
jgi:serine/threonine protein kinase